MVNEGKVYIIKLGNRPSEEFNPEKLHNSIYATCLGVRTPEGQAEDIAKRVTVGVMKWCETHPEITSSDIRLQVLKNLRPLHEDASDLYEQIKAII